MTKKELLKFDPPFRMIVDLYGDDEEIPKGVIEALYHTPKEREIVIWCNEKFADEFDKALKEVVENYYKPNIMKVDLDGRIEKL